MSIQKLNPNFVENIKSQIGTVCVQNITSQIYTATFRKKWLFELSRLNPNFVGKKNGDIVTAFVKHKKSD